MHFEVHNELIYHNKYELERERQEKEIIGKNFDSIFDPFEREYFKVKKMEIIEKMTRKSQESESSGHNDGNFNELDGGNYEMIYQHISFYIFFLSFG